jgi:hypothetical protein
VNKPTAVLDPDGKFFRGLTNLDGLLQRYCEKLFLACSGGTLFKISVEIVRNPLPTPPEGNQYLKGLSQEILRPVFWPVWIYLGLNGNRFWFLNFNEGSLILDSYFKY